MTVTTHPPPTLLFLYQFQTALFLNIKCCLQKSSKPYDRLEEIKRISLQLCLTFGLSASMLHSTSELTRMDYDLFLRKLKLEDPPWWLEASGVKVPEH